MILITSKKPAPAPSLAVKLYRELCVMRSGYHQVSGITGNPTASKLLIAPPCTEEELQSGLPFSQAGNALTYKIMSSLGIEPNKEFLVISASLFGTKHNKASCTPIQEYVKQCASMNLFELYVCVGSEAFKHIFGGGRKPTPVTLAGATLYVRETGHKPLFTLPSPDALIFTETEDDRANWRNERAAKEAQQRMTNCIKLLKQKFFL